MFAFRKAAFATALLLATAATRAQAASPTPTPPPFATDQRPLLEEPSSVADPDGADAIVYNPADLHDDDEGGEVAFIHSDRVTPNQPGDGDALFMKTGGPLSFGMEWARPAKDTTRPLWTLASSIPFAKSFALGTGVTGTFGKTWSPYSFTSMNVGALWRPGRFLSLGATAWNAAHTETPLGLDLRARYAGAVAIRPFTNLVSLSVDAARTDGAKHVDLRYGVRAEPIPGLSLFFTADDAKRYTASLAFSFSHVRIGTTAFRDQDLNYVGTATRVQSRERRQPTVAKIVPTFAKMKVGGSLPDRSESSFFSPGVQTLPGVIGVLRAAQRDRGLDGVVIRLEGVSSGLARSQELRAAILETRGAGKKVLCYIENADFRTYYVASACDRIAMHPAATLEIAGVAAELGYYKGTLDKLGVQVETARVGPYKGAPEPFLQTEPSPETLEVSNAMLDASFGQTVEGIAVGRKMDPGAVRAAIDGGYYDPPSAKKAGLIDYVCYPDELDKTAADFLGKNASTVGKYGTVAPVSRDWGTPPRIAVVYAAGAIAQGKSRTTPLTGETVMGSDTIAAAVKEAAEDPLVRAIVLRVDSPGGDGFASDEVWHEVERAKKKKPVVVSMANVAASGGYFISQGANYIFADPGTVTGSIGVFMLKPNFKGTYAKIDYHAYPLSRGAFSELFTASRPWTPEEKEEAGRLIDVFYRDFIAKAAAGRKTTPEAIDAVGRGHVWMGTKAKELKLVDELGGLTDAVEKAKALAHIPKGRQVAWEAFPREKGLKESLGASEGLPDDLRAELAALAGGADLGTLELLATMGDGPVSWSPAAAAWMPHGAAPATAAREERTRNWLWPIPLRD